MAELRGICYSIGVGPGDPELLTLKALRTMEQCGVVAAPRTKGGHMLALDIAQQAMDLSDKEILPLSFPMTNDQKERKRAHAAAAGEIAAYLDRGEDVAMLTLGDPSVYATSSYVCRLLEEQGYRTETIAGVPSFCAASAALSRELVQDGEPLLMAGVQADGRCSVVTCEPNRWVAPIHNRMPLILPADLADRWIFPGTRPETLLSGALTDMVMEKEV